MKKFCKENVVRMIPQVILHIIILFNILLLLFPLAMTTWNAFKLNYVFEDTMWYPTFPLVIKNISDAYLILEKYIWNTVLVGVAGGGGLLFIASISAFTFAKMRFPGRKIMFSMVIALLMMPGVLTLIPQVAIYKTLGISNNDSLFALILPLWTSGPIFGIFLLTSFFRGIPNDLFEAGRIDGATEFRCYLSIALPLCLPILGTLAIMTLVNIWNEYLWPMTVMDENLTISAALVKKFTSQNASNVTMQFAGYLVSSIPLVLLFVFANRFYIQGLIGSSIKM